MAFANEEVAGHRVINDFLVFRCMMSTCHDLGQKRKEKVVVMAEILTFFFQENNKNVTGPIYRA